MASQDFTAFKSDPILNEDAFQTEQSKRLFDAIDELRSCGANNEIGLPEASWIQLLLQRSM